MRRAASETAPGLKPRRADIFDNADRSIVSDDEIERSMTKHRNLKYDESFAPRATEFHLFAGDGCYVPYQWPHWVRTAGSFSISMAITRKTRDVRRLNDLHFFNSMLRGIGLPQQPPGTRQVERYGHRAVALQARPLAHRRLAEGRLPHALLRQPLHHLRVRHEAFEEGGAGLALRVGVPDRHGVALHDLVGALAAHPAVDECEQHLLGEEQHRERLAGPLSVPEYPQPALLRLRGLPDLTQAADRILLYTDGLTDALSEDRVPLGEDLLSQWFADAAELPLTTVGDKLLESVARHRSGPPLDGMTLLLVELRRAGF